MHKVSPYWILIFANVVFCSLQIFQALWIFILCALCVLMVCTLYKSFIDLSYSMTHYIAMLSYYWSVLKEVSVLCCCIWSSMPWFMGRPSSGSTDDTQVFLCIMGAASVWSLWPWWRFSLWCCLKVLETIYWTENPVILSRVHQKTHAFLITVVQEAYMSSMVGRSNLFIMDLLHRKLCSRSFLLHKKCSCFI